MKGMDFIALEDKIRVSGYEYDNAFHPLSAQQFGCLYAVQAPHFNIQKENINIKTGDSGSEFLTGFRFRDQIFHALKL